MRIKNTAAPFKNNVMSIVLERGLSFNEHLEGKTFEVCMSALYVPP